MGLEEKRKSGIKIVLLCFILLIIILVVWGLIGGSVARDIGTTCDMGIGDSLCWTWHKNLVGQIAEEINEYIN